VTDPALVAKKLAAIETAVTELRTLARPAAIAHDVREARFVEHTLQMAIQALLDVASHVVRTSGSASRGPIARWSRFSPATVGCRARTSRPWRG